MDFTELIYNYMQKRKSYDSQKNVVYIINAFLTYSDKNIKEIEKEDIHKYFRFLIEKTKDGCLEEEYVRMIYIELRSFFAYCYKINYITSNPFSDITLPIKDKKYIETSKFPDLIDVNDLLEKIDEHSIYVAVILALRMGLSTSELINIKKEDIIHNKEDDLFYIKIEKRNNIRFLCIPNDIIPDIKREILSTPANCFYLLSPNKKDKYGTRYIQIKLKRYNTDITFSDLRNLSIYLMFAGGANIEEVIGYTGMKGEWFKKYDKIPTKYKFDAVKYSKLQIK